MKKLGMIVTTALFALVVSGGPASADSGLVSSRPAAGAQVSRAPEEVRLTFDKPVQTGGTNVVTVTGPDGASWTSGAMGIDENVVTALLSPLGPKGDYVVDYSIRLGDPAPLTGQLRFTLTKPGPAAKNAPKQEAATMSWQTWSWLGGIVAVIAAAATAGGIMQARTRR